MKMDDLEKNKQNWRPMAAEYLMLIVRTTREMEFVMINLENSPKTI